MEMKQSGKLVPCYKSVAYNEIRGRVWCLEADMILAAWIRRLGFRLCLHQLEHCALDVLLISVAFILFCKLIPIRLLPPDGTGLLLRIERSHSNGNETFYLACKILYKCKMAV